MPRLLRKSSLKDKITEIFNDSASEQSDGKDFLNLLNDDLPTTREWIIRNVSKCKSQAKHYFYSLFPILTWLPNYNRTWLLGDLIAGITVGCVVVPQSMSYAQLAGLPTEYGLYSSFVGVIFYCIFATSKDVTIGPVAVMSLIVSNAIQNVHNIDPSIPGPLIASLYALLLGIIVLGMGLLRIGFVIEFIPMPAVAGFMTGSAITIAAGQVCKLLGIHGINSREAAYLVIIDTLKNLHKVRLDAAFGLTALAILYLWRFIGNYVSRSKPRFARVAFFALVMRSAVVIIFGTLVSFLIVRNSRDNPPISVVGVVPSGFRHVGAVKFNSSIVSKIAGDLPVGCIVLLLEHIAIAKSFGRVNDYKIDPNQEMIAIGITNVVGSFFSAYPATGSFSRSAIKAKSGVRTPLAGIFTGIIVIFALYVLTSVFFYIPQSVLAAVIIHAVGDLITHPRQVYTFWRIQPFEALIFFAAVFVTIFTSVDYGIYTSMITSAALLLYRIAMPRGRFLGIVPVVDSTSLDEEDIHTRDLFLPLSEKSKYLSRGIMINPPPPGIIIFRLEESFLYPNASNINSMIVNEAKKLTKPGELSVYRTPGERPWNMPAKRAPSLDDMEEEESKALLKAVILDFSSVSHIDTTGIQSIIDTRKELDRYAGHEIQFHFANILTPWVKRALVAAGFGVEKSSKDRPVEVVCAVPLPNSLNNTPTECKSPSSFDLEAGSANSPTRQQCSSVELERKYYLKSTAYPYFHLDLHDALRAVLAKKP